MDKEKELESIEVNEVEEIKEPEAEDSAKDEVERRVRRQIAKKEEKNERMGISRLGSYLKEEHKWENFLFLFLSILVMVLGGLILSNTLIVRDDIPVIGKHPAAFAWVLIVAAFLSFLYSLYPFFKPAFPEFKKITWPTLIKFIADSIRVFTFIIILVGLFVLYDSLITGILRLIF